MRMDRAYGAAAGCEALEWFLKISGWGRKGGNGSMNVIDV